MTIELFSGVYVDEAPAEEPAGEAAPAAAPTVDYPSIAAQQRTDLLAHLRSLKHQLSEVRSFVERAHHKVQTETQDSADGVTLLQVRNHCLLEYLENLAQFGAAKASGRPVAEAVASLVSNRCVLEKTKPLITQMRYQLQKYEEIENRTAVPLLRPNPSSMVDAGNKSHSDGLVAAQYQPPQIMSVLYPKTADDSEKAANFARTVKARTKQSVLMDEAVAEIRDEPVETGRRVAQARKVKEFLKRVREKAELEEELMQRLPTTKKDRQMMREIERMQGSFDAVLDFEKRPQKGGGKGKDADRKGRGGRGRDRGRGRGRRGGR
jgi:U3 small nucleolar ribonucleoprotein protein LCP5